MVIVGSYTEPGESHWISEFRRDLVPSDKMVQQDMFCNYFSKYVISTLQMYLNSKK